MKKTVLFICAGLVLFAAPAAAGADLPENVNRDLVVKNLVVGLNTDNFGLQRSCALMLGHLQSSDAVIPLMGALHCCRDAGVRSAAAWALCQIDSDLGRYAVKQMAIWCECGRTRATCAWYYNLYVKDGTFLIHQPDLDLTAEARP